MSASKLSQALNCSLDDYIAEKGIVSSLRPKANGTSGESVFKRPMRSEMDDDENEDDLVFEDRLGDVMDTEDPPLSFIREVRQNDEGEIEEIDNGEKKPTNVSIQVDSERECRTFTTEEKKRGITKLPSQQWRLRRENQVSKKPAGIPPLMSSVKAVFDRNTDRLIASMNEQAKFQNVDAKDRATQQFQNHKRQWKNNRNQNHQFRHNGFQHNRNNPYYFNRNNGNRPQGFIPNVSSAQMNKNQIKDLRPFISSSSSSMPPMLQAQMTAGSGLWRPMATVDQPRQLVAFADMLGQMGQQADNRTRDQFVDVMRNVMNIQQQQQAPAALVPMMTADSFARMNPTELMPFAAQTMLNHMSAVQQNFGPKYDMKLQKEIHSLQGKPMFYGQNGVVISSDGTGVDNERVKPVSTDVSMNMRFS